MLVIWVKDSMLTYSFASLLGSVFARISTQSETERLLSASTTNASVFCSYNFIHDHDQSEEWNRRLEPKRLQDLRVWQALFHKTMHERRSDA
jgi:hypothetical protein